jgi:hypothetical protein
MKQKPKRVFGMTYLQIGILAGVGILALALVGCGAIMLLFSNQPISQSGASNPQPISQSGANTPLSTSQSGTNIPLSTPNPHPAHNVNDFWDNGKGTNFAYFIVADKSLMEEEAETIIQQYQDKHRGYKLMNILIFCDEVYADFIYLDAIGYTDPGDEIVKHIMYWSMSGEWASSGGFFKTKPDVSYPTFGVECK